LPLVALLDSTGDLLSEELFVEYQNGQLDSLTNFRKKKEKSELSKKIIPNIDHFYASINIPSELSFQTVPPESLNYKPNGFILSQRNAAVMSLPIGEKRGTVEAEWHVSVRSTRLKPMYVGERFASAEIPASPLKKKLALKTSTELNFRDKTFQDWLAKHSLLIGVFGIKESPVQFGFRTYNTLCRIFTFNIPAEGKVTDIIRTMKADSAALS